MFLTIGNAVGKEGLNDYIRKGYITMDGQASDQISRTLDFGFADFAVSRAFLKLASDAVYIGSSGQDKKTALLEKSKVLFDRSVQAPKKLFDKRYGLMVGKLENGESKPNFNG